jgi:hypothetical protein
MSILLTALLVQMAVPMPAGTSTVQLPAIKQSRTCREMLTSSSRLGAMRVCKTRAEWQRWERCHSATRYCAPLRVAFLPDNRDLICKYLKVTGSRIAQEKICATRRQWDVMEQETQETVRDRQNQSKIIRNGGD